MARLSLRLLGPFQVTFDDNLLTRLESEKELALLAYLVAEPGRPHRREALAELLWPHRAEGAARTNLRHTLTILRRAIGDRADIADSASFLTRRESTLSPHKDVLILVK